MAVRVVRLGTPRAAREGVRIGTVRRPPRGVPRSRFSSEDWYDVWYPNLAPSVETMKLAQAARTERAWKAFEPLTKGYYVNTEPSAGERRLRETFGFEGSPVRINVRVREKRGARSR